LFIPKNISFALLFSLFSAVPIFAQNSSLRQQKIVVTDAPVVLDSLTVYWPSLYVTRDFKEISTYTIDTLNNALRFDKAHFGDTLLIRYRVLPTKIHGEFYNKDSIQVYNKPNSPDNPFMITSTLKREDIFGSSALKKSGSISRGINVGNAQDLSVNSTMNIQLSGEISQNLNILATLTDDNIPIQPDGTTNKLQEFDQLFIQLYNDDFKLIAGDFWARTPKGYFMTYNKRAQGLTAQYNLFNSPEKGKMSVYGSGAFSRGKFNRQLIDGVEGNQGPYRLRGAENEPFIIVLSGSERVFLNGVELQRGQEYDYIMNYNTSEITFTTKRPIDKDSRIIVEFQYADQNYARSLFNAGMLYEKGAVKTWFNVYSEQDAKNQPVQQDLTPEQRFFISQIGDNLQDAVVNGIDSVGFRDNQVMYKMVDSLGYDSVMVFSVAPDSAVYSVTFSQVAQGQGDYVFDRFTAVGRVYRWVEPINGVPQGNYRPVRLVVTPKQRQMITSGVEIDLGKDLQLFSEVALSNNDVNTFSSLDRDDNVSVAGKFILKSQHKLSNDSLATWQLQTNTGIEFTGRNFVPIERFRTAEFDRDWNILHTQASGYQLIANTGARILHKNKGFMTLNGNLFSWGDDFLGLKANTDGQWADKGFQIKWTSNAVNTSGIKNSFFIRHKIDVSQSFKYLKIGFMDEHEYNRIEQDFISPIVQENTYHFYDWQFYITQSDTIKNKFKVYYRQRDDKLSNATNFGLATSARNFGATYDWVSNTKTQLRMNINYRNLRIVDSTLINIQPENTFLGRLEHSVNLWKGALRTSTFYELGSGLELKREFIYIEVLPGRGVYVWRDYNADGIKDLNEFEIALYADEANYVRIFTPSNEYIRTFSNEFSQSIFLHPEKIWSKKKGVLGFLSRVSNQTQIRLNRKINGDFRSNINPFTDRSNDTTLISESASYRNSIFFNRTNQIAGGDYTFSRFTNKLLLANGFDERLTQFHQFNFRWNIKQKFTLKTSYEFGQKASFAQYTTGRDFQINYFKVFPEFIYQPDTKLRISTTFRYEDKQNVFVADGERALINDFGIEFRYNQPQKGTLSGTMNVLKIEYNGAINSALGFEMLESLRPGLNYTWTLNYQRNLGKNLQLSIRYNGRKSEGNRMIHAGGVEMRAMF
jgi:hypothetical protein